MINDDIDLQDKHLFALKENGNETADESAKKESSLPHAHCIMSVS